MNINVICTLGIHGLIAEVSNICKLQKRSIFGMSFVVEEDLDTHIYIYKGEENVPRCQSGEGVNIVGGGAPPLSQSWAGSFPRQFGHLPPVAWDKDLPCSVGLSVLIPGTHVTSRWSCLFPSSFSCCLPLTAYFLG